MSYFVKYNFLNDLEFKNYKRPLVPGCKNIFVCSVGDVVKVFFFLKGSAFFFEGLCISVTKKHFFLPNVSLLVINTIQNCTVFCIFSFFYNLIFKIIYNDFKKKSYTFSKAKYKFLLSGKNVIVK